MCDRIIGSRQKPTSIMFYTGMRRESLSGRFKSLVNGDGHDSEQPDVIIVLNKPTIALVYNSVFQRSETHKYTI